MNSSLGSAHTIMRKSQTFTHFFNVFSMVLAGLLTGCAPAAAPYLTGVGSNLAGGGTTASSAVPRGPEVEVSRVTIVADNDANDNTAVPVDLVICYDQGVFVQVMSLTARQYYLKAQQLQQDFPNIIQVQRWEVTPGQNISDFPINLNEDEPIGAVVFADYVVPGDHRIRVGAGEQMRIQLKNDQFLVTMRDE